MANTSDTLFPILPSRTTALGRVAQAAVPSREGHQVRYRPLPTRSVLNRSISRRRLSLAWSVNPYRGCEFGCRYCYARYTHEFLAPAAAVPDGAGQEGIGAADAPDLRRPESFEQEIFVKQNAAWLLEQELRRQRPTGEIALGTATDPYQPIERTEQVTRSLLKVFARQAGLKIGIVTKSRLITRDIDLLQEIGRRNMLVVHVTITTADAHLARKLEPRAPRPDLRFDAVSQLRAAGVRTGVLASPLLPGITDNEAALSGVAASARAADASFLAGEPLFLKSCSRPTYLSFVREHFPALEAEYAARFAHAEFASRSYREAMQAMVSRVCRRFAVPERSTDALLTRDVGEGAALRKAGREGEAPGMRRRPPGKISSFDVLRGGVVSMRPGQGVLF